MNILPDFITEGDEAVLAREIELALAKIPERKTGLRNRVIRFGWDYEKPDKWLGEPPFWTNIVCQPRHKRYDSITVNEYVRGQRISPHVDSKKFDAEIIILSLLADATMRFTSPAGEIRDFVLPRRSLAVMSGELRQKWTHETLPLDAELRYSIVYRKRLEDGAEIRKLHFDGRTITFSK